MQCPKCNMNVRDDATVCMYCGTSLQQGVNPVQQPVQNNVVQGTNMQPVATPQAPATSQPSASVIEYKKREKRKKILLLLLIPIVAVGAYFGLPIIQERMEMKVKAQEEFEEESETYFNAAALLTKSKILVSEGRDPIAGEFYYVLIDDDIKDKEHPLTPKDDKDRGCFDGKGYVILIMGDSIINVHGFVCLNNGNSEKRFIAKKTTNVAETIDGNSQNSFDSLSINEKGKCDISELLGNTTSALHQLTAR